jgi:predicted RNase H-like HicB family nuclease
MYIPVVIHKDEASVYGVTVPDIPGCHSWGETIDHAMRNVRDAIDSHVETLQYLGESVAVAPSQIEQLFKDAEYAGGVWALVDIDPARLDSKP